MYEELSQKQQEILMFIKSSIQLKGYPPSFREISAAVGISSTSSVHAHLDKLESYGYIRRNPTKSRTIEIIEQTDNNFLTTKKTVDIPVIGEVTAGSPILAVENIVDTIPLPASYVEGKELFFLKIQGESMIDKGIYDGDFALFLKQSNAKNGDVVVALIDNEYATVKTFYRDSEDVVRLQPENEKMSPIFPSQVFILGKLTAIIRYL